jgi:hypothetical protein
VMALGGLIALVPAWRRETVVVRLPVPVTSASAGGLR